MDHRKDIFAADFRRVAPDDFVDSHVFRLVNFLIGVILHLLGNP